MDQYQGVVHCSMHPEIVPGTLVQANKIEDYQHSLDFKWMTVKLSSGLNRDILVKDVKKL